MIGSCLSNFAGCKSGKKEQINYTFSPGKKDPYTITQYSFKAVNNPALSSDIEAAIEPYQDGNWYSGSNGKIEVWVPYGTDISALKADYKTSGDHVTVNAIVQESGKTPNDFRDSVAYEVVSADGDFRIYIVEVNELPGSSKDISAFMFRSEVNPPLVVDYRADIEDTNIQVNVTTSADISKLVASFASTGQRVLVNGTAQKSGVTINDFSDTVVYTVEAADGTTKSYFVNVTSSIEAAKEMTSFILTASANPELRVDVLGTINGTVINLEVPCNVTMTSLIPSFTITGGTVSVNGVDQISGVTAVDLSGLTQYKVTAEDGSYIDYQIVVKKTQYLRWLYTIPITQIQYNYPYGTGVSIAKDSSDNIYATGYINGTADMDFGPGVDSRGPGVYIVKIDHTGDWVWTKFFSEYYYNLNVKSIAADDGGNVYICGMFDFTIDFDPGPGVDQHTSNPSSYDMCIYVTKINNDGTYGWTRTFGTDYQSLSGMALDSNGDVIVVGNFEGTVDFDPSDAVDDHTSNGNSDIFLTKITSSGTYSWTRTIGSSRNDSVKSVSMDTSGGIYITGIYSGSLDFDPGAGQDIRQPPGEIWDSMYVAKYMTDGSYAWANTDNSWDSWYGLTSCFKNGSLYVAATDYYNLHIVKIDEEGPLDWARAVTWVNLSPNEAYPLAMDSDNNGHVYIAGHYSGAVDFDFTSYIDKRTTNMSDDPFNQDIFLMQFNDDGSYGSTITLDSPGNDAANSIVVDSQGFVNVIGEFRYSIDFDPSSGVILRTAANEYYSDIYISSYQFP